MAGTIVALSQCSATPMLGLSWHSGPSAGALRLQRVLELAYCELIGVGILRDILRVPTGEIHHKLVCLRNTREIFANECAWVAHRPTNLAAVQDHQTLKAIDEGHDEAFRITTPGSLP